MKRKTAFAMAVSLTVVSVFGSGTAALAQETVEAVTVAAENMGTPEPGIGEAAFEAAEDTTACTEAYLAEETEEAVFADDGFAEETAETAPADGKFSDEIIEDAAEDFAGLPQPELFTADETDGEYDAVAEASIEADAELSVDLASGEAEWNEDSQLEAVDVAADGSEVVATLDASCFPDENFLNYIKEQGFDANGDGSLSKKEADKVEVIDVSFADIGNLKGIEYFLNLQNLNCSNNDLASLDVSENTVLTTLDCSGNGLTSLDVSKNIALTYLGCSTNELGSLNVSENTALTELQCDGNLLSSLDVSTNIDLKRLTCSYNSLMRLDVSNNTDLKVLYCYGNGLTNLDVGNTALTELYCYDNELTNLDVSKNTALTELDCCMNQLMGLDVNMNTALAELNCSSNELTSLDVSENTALTILMCGGNSLTSLDVSKNTNLVQLNCYGNELTDMDVSKNNALTNLECGGNQLTDLDVSKNNALTDLECGGNQLTSLDVSKNNDLQFLHCEGNQLTSLDISKNFALDLLWGDNQRKMVRLPYKANGWQLDMAELVGNGNLAKVSFTTDVPAMSTSGVIEFPKNALPEEISYVFDCGLGNRGDELTLRVTLKLEKESEQIEPNPPQTEKTPGQTENKSEHTVHTFGAYTVTKEPTVLAEGTETRTCTVCGATESRAVAKLTPAMELNATSIKLKTKQSTNKIKVSGLASGDAVASWKSSNPKIVTVNSKGKIKAKAKKGRATVTVTLKSGLSEDIQVTVQKNEVACTKVTLNKKSVTLKKGKSFTLETTVSPITCIQKVKYSTSDSSVATVSGKGVIKAKKKGSATITVKVGKKKVKCKVKVK